jgi:hypothetical protein
VTHAHRRRGGEGGRHAAAAPKSAGHWSELADRAATVLDASGGYADLVERRLVAALRGPAGMAGTAEVSGTAHPPAGTDPVAVPEALVLSDAERAALFAGFADLVDAARSCEQQAVTTLRQAG